MTSKITDPYSTEVLIIGGSYSGMAAAMALGRALRDVILMDTNQPCNRFAPQAHNLPGYDGMPPSEIHAHARKQLLRYSTVRLAEDLATDIIKDQSGNFCVPTASGRLYRSKKLLLATGLKDELPDIPGIQACWGKSVIHCPYCHGYEFKGAATAILAAGNDSLHFISLIKEWSSNLKVFTNGIFRFEKPAADFLIQQGIEVTDKKIISVLHDKGQMHTVRLEGAAGHGVENLALDVLYVQLPVKQAFPLPSQLNCRLTAAGYIEVDEGRRSSVKGLYAAGDNSNSVRSLSAALAAGTIAGAMINMDLVNEKRPLP